MSRTARYCCGPDHVYGQFVGGHFDGRFLAPASGCTCDLSLDPVGLTILRRVSSLELARVRPFAALLLLLEPRIRARRRLRSSRTPIASRPSP